MARSFCISIVVHLALIITLVMISYIAVAPKFCPIPPAGPVPGRQESKMGSPGTILIRPVRPSLGVAPETPKTIITRHENRPLTPKPPVAAQARRIAETIKPRPATSAKVIHKRDKKNHLVEDELPKPTATPVEVETAEVVDSPHETSPPKPSMAQRLDAASTATDKKASSDQNSPAVELPPINISKCNSSPDGNVPGQKGNLSIDTGIGMGLRDGAVCNGSRPIDMSQTYFMIVLTKIERNFKPPQTRPGVNCQVAFRIQRDGTIGNIQVLPDKGTGRPSWDQFAVQALEMTGRLPELYDGCKEPYLDLVVTFRYNKD